RTFARRAEVVPTVAEVSTRSESSVIHRLRLRVSDHGAAARLNPEGAAAGAIAPASSLEHAIPL
ncbi:MAG: hypothetical protein ABW186_11600, partial [Rhodanobacteraceae bacterium]